MGQSAPSSAVNESLAAFFVENLCQEADFVYRLCFALSLNPSMAKSCVQETYQKLLPMLNELVREDSTTIRTRLAKMTWNLCENRKGQETDQSPTGQFLKTLKLEERSALVLVDESGFSPVEAASIMGVDENKVRLSLAKARKALTQLQK